MWANMRRSRKFCQGGQTLTFFYLFIFLIVQIPLKAGHHRPTSETLIKWRFAGVLMMAQHWMLACSFVIFRGSRPVLLRNPIFLWFFQRGGGLKSLPPSGTVHALHLKTMMHTFTWYTGRFECIFVIFQGDLDSLPPLDPHMAKGWLSDSSQILMSF